MDNILALATENIVLITLVSLFVVAGGSAVWSFLNRNKKTVVLPPQVEEVAVEIEEVVEPVVEEYPIPVVREDAPTVPRARRAPRAKKVIGEDGLEVPKDPATVNESGKKTKRSDKLRRSKEK